MSVFWTLVRNDLKIRKPRPFRQSIWGKVYIGIAVLFGAGWYTWAVLNGYMQPKYLFWYMPFLLFSPFWVSNHTINQEWRGGTVGWWLSLPYKRRLLLGAKFTANLIRFFQIAGFAFVITIIFSMEAVLLRPDIWGGQFLLDMLGTGIKLYALLLIVSPVSIIFGTTMGVIRNSKWNVLTPLLWGIMILLSNVLIWSVNLLIKSKPADSILNSISQLSAQNFLEVLLIVLLGSALITGLLFSFSVYTLDRKVEV